MDKTYSINVQRILQRRRGNYDLEDEYLWFYEYLKRDRSWKEVKFCQKDSPVTISDRVDCSLIKLDCPNIELLNEKQNFAKICQEMPWMPRSIVLEFVDRNLLTDESELLLKSFTRSLSQGTLLFLKKAGPGIGGGYDVRALMYEGKSLMEEIEELVAEMNENPKYRRHVFVLQQGVMHPLLTALGQKLDLRLYMLIVGSEDRITYYACKVGDIRNTVAPYVYDSTETSVQVTNISQNKAYVKDLSEITQVFTEMSIPWYGQVMRRFLQIAKDLSLLYGPLIQDEDTRFVTLLGLDAVVDSATMMPMIVEINRRPTVYTPEEAKAMKYSSALFMKEVFELGVNDGEPKLFVPVHVIVKA